MAALRNNNLATTECYSVVFEPYINSKPCDYLPTFDVTREATLKLSEPPSTAVTLFFATQTSDETTGLQSFSWTDGDCVPNSVTDAYLTLANSPINKGKSKLVFKLSLNGVAYVAKRCYTLGDGSPVCIVANRDQLVKEGVTLGRAEFFLNHFNAECEYEAVEIAGFEVTDVLIAREGVASLTEPFVPSPASGFTSTDYSSLTPAEEEELTTTANVISSITWLLERERGDVQLRKNSGTLDHPKYSDKQGATINAFQHFVYLYSKKTLVLADIQASESHSLLSQKAVLFDLMSHTADRESGAGDHGDVGIKTFVDQHECVQKCVALNLEALKTPENEEHAEEEDESG
ncbi:kinase-like protein [Favolaschia claudopus]|uniref:Kinase-like protein n=1 Tax=Favolaschia claudopus TaxID=2862362 RepID=A0AAW0BS78_9AGAR